MTQSTAKAYLDPDTIPLDWNLITPEWMTEALSGLLPDVKVKDVALLNQHDGSNRRARMGVTYAAGSGPATVFLKAHAADHREAHVRNGNLWNEPRLFASGIELPVDHPIVYKALEDQVGLDFLLVMEDIEQRHADCRDATRPLSVEQVANGLKGLARVHSRYWGVNPQTEPKLAWLQTWAPTDGWRFGLRKYAPRGIERGRDLIPAAVAQYDIDEILAVWTRYVGTLAKDPVTLVHGDTHIGNTYVLPGDDVGFLDWQVVRRGGWSLDVSQFIISALTIEDRRNHDAALLGGYLEALDLPDERKPTASEALFNYRAAAIYGLTIWLSTLGTDGWQPHEVSRALVSRFAAAFVELDTLAALAAIGA